MKTERGIRSYEDLQERLERSEAFRVRMKRPFVTLSYAQSVDGSIASRDRRQIRLSGNRSMILTHRIRAGSDAVLIGIGTVLTDNPRLTVRLVNGKNPQPIILDTRLRIPLDSNLMGRSDLSTWVVGGKDKCERRIEELTRAGATVLSCVVGMDGRIDLYDLMGLLARRGIKSLMVEGGAEVITSFINSRLVDQFVITIAPRFVGGLQVLGGPGMKLGGSLRLEKVFYQSLEEDLIVWAVPVWRNH